MAMTTTYSTHQRQDAARKAALIATLGLALVASVVPLAAQSTNANMAAALEDMDGTNGWLLKRGTTVLASQNAGYVFEPASAINFIVHLYAELMIKNNWVSPASLISGTNGSCPVGPGTDWTESLEDAMFKMMWHSNNSRMQAIVDYFGAGAINAAAHTLGAVDTNINHIHGCAAAALANPNETTLNDMTTLYRKAFTGDLLTAERRQHMWARMPNQLQILKDTANYVAWSSYYQVLTGPPKAFRDNLKVATKAGGYTLSNQHYLSIAGYVEIPFKTAYGILPQKYTFGIFIHKATKDVQLVNDAFEEAIGKLFLEEIKLAMGTFF
jgi:hypothetical protein